MKTATDFILAAIASQQAKNKANGKDYKGIHTVFSGLNDALRAVFGEGLTAEDRKALPMKLVEEAITEGAIVKVFSKGGPSLYRPEDAPVRADRITTAEQAYKKFGMTPPPVIAPKQTTRRASK